jgi:hypothetical protein
MKKHSYLKVHKETKEYCHILMTNESKARLLVMLSTQHNDIIRHCHHEQFLHPREMYECQDLLLGLDPHPPLLNEEYVGLGNPGTNR